MRMGQCQGDESAKFSGDAIADNGRVQLHMLF